MVVANQLDELISAARKDGWASGICSTKQLEFQTWGRAYTIVAGRAPSGRGFEALRPTDPEHANKRSLSAVFGRGQQPLHTDGAHHALPPDIVILAAAEPTSVPTLLWGASYERLIEIGDDIRHGLFAVDDGQASFLAPACNGWPTLGGQIRFDPGCMTPVDSRARGVSAHFANALESATRFDWTQQDQVLVIDNRRVLHARADSVSDPNRLMYRLMLRVDQEARS